MDKFHYGSDHIAQQRKTFQTIQGMLSSALTGQNPLGVIDSLDSLTALWAQCAAQRNSGFIAYSSSEMARKLAEQSADLVAMVVSGAITPPMLTEMAGTLGVRSLHNALKQYDFYGDPQRNTSLQEEAALFLAELREKEGENPSDFKNLNLDGLMEEGNYYAACHAIEFCAQKENGAEALASMRLFQGFRHYHPARLTRTNYQKLPKPLLNSIRKHQDMILEAANLTHAEFTNPSHKIRYGVAKMPCPLWLLRELGTHGMHDLAKTLAGYKYDILEDGGILLTQHSHREGDTDDGYRAISTLHLIGLEAVAEKTASRVNIGPDHFPLNKHEAFAALNLCTYAVESDTYSAQQAETLFDTYMPLLKDNNYRSPNDVVNMMVELHRHLGTEPVSDAFREKFDRMISIFAPCLHGYATCLTNLKEKDEELAGKVMATTGFKRSRLSEDLAI